MVVLSSTVQQSVCKLCLRLRCFLQGSGSVSTESIMAMFGSKAPTQTQQEQEQTKQDKTDATTLKASEQDQQAITELVRDAKMLLQCFCPSYCPCCMCCKPVCLPYPHGQSSMQFPDLQLLLCRVRGHCLLLLDQVALPLLRPMDW